MKKQSALLSLPVVILLLITQLIASGQATNSSAKSPLPGDTVEVKFDNMGRLLSDVPSTLSKKVIRIIIEKNPSSLTEANTFVREQTKKAKAALQTSLLDNADLLYYLATPEEKEAINSLSVEELGFDEKGNEIIKQKADTAKLENALGNINASTVKTIDSLQKRLLDSLSKNPVPFKLEYFNTKTRKWVLLPLTDREEYYDCLINLNENDVGNKIKIRLIKRDILKEAIISHYNVMADSIVENIKLLMKKNASVLTTANTILSPYRSLIDSLVQLYPIYGSKCAANILQENTCPEINFSKKRIDELNCLLQLIACKISHSKEEAIWLKYFLLLNGGKIQFDPFVFSDAEDIAPATAGDSTLLQQNRIARNNFITTSKIENSAIVIPQANKEQEIRNYFYGESPFTDSKDFRQSYPDDYRITHIIHNVPDSVNIKVHITETPFTEQSFFSASLPFIDSLTSIFSLLNNKNTLVKGFNALISRKNTTVVAGVSSLDDLLPITSDEVREAFKNVTRYREDSALYNGRIPPGHLEMKTDKTASYSSQELDIRASDPPELVNYSIYAVDANATADTIYNSSYKVGKRTRIQIAAGLAYTFHHVWETTATTAGDTVKIHNDEDRLRLVVGLKFYPVKGLYLSDGKFLSSTYGTAWQRFNIFTGFSLPSPLKNIYLGVGWDILPGLNINAGVHFYQNRKYTVVNNAIGRESLDYKIAAPYASITVDPQTLIGIFKFIGQSF